MGVTAITGIKSIQRGVLTIPNPSGTATATVTAVNMAKAQLRMNGAKINSTDAGHIARIELTNATTITASRWATAVQTDVAWELIEEY